MATRTSTRSPTTTTTFHSIIYEPTNCIFDCNDVVAVTRFLNVYTFALGYIIEILLILVFLVHFMKLTSDICNAYNILFFTTLVLDLPLFLMRYVETAFFLRPLGWYIHDVFSKRYYTFVKIYFSVCHLVMTFNRFTGILYPLKHGKWWTNRTIAFSLILSFIIALSQIVSVILFTKGDNNLLIPFDNASNGLRIYFLIVLLLDTTAQIITQALSLLLSIYIYIRVHPCSSTVNQENSELVRKAELRLFYVLMIINITSAIRTIFDVLVGQLTLYSTTTTGWLFVVKQLAFTAVSDLAYFTQHHLGIFLLLAMSSKVRQKFFEFYYIDKLLPMVSRYVIRSSGLSNNISQNQNSSSLFNPRQQQQRSPRNSNNSRIT